MVPRNSWGIIVVTVLLMASRDSRKFLFSSRVSSVVLRLAAGFVTTGEPCSVSWFPVIIQKVVPVKLNQLATPGGAEDIPITCATNIMHLAAVAAHRAAAA